jgi:hypothetical protein
LETLFCEFWTKLPHAIGSDEPLRHSNVRGQAMGAVAPLGQ